MHHWSASPPGLWSASQRGPPWGACHGRVSLPGLLGPQPDFSGATSLPLRTRSCHSACALLTLVAFVAQLSCPLVPSYTALILSACSFRPVCSGSKSFVRRRQSPHSALVCGRGRSSVHKHHRGADAYHPHSSWEEPASRENGTQ